jgi:hypothetical protein
MSKAVYYCALIVTLGVIIVMSVARPDLLGKENHFLQGFVDHEFVTTMGVIATITLASTSQIHLTFNAIEERLKKRGLSKTRAGVRQAAYALILLLGASVLLATIKPMAGEADITIAFFNGLSLFVLVWSVLILLSITRLIFAIDPIID